ncbi:MAG TPA: HD domain-containing phosphohydrolase [Gemmatimonadales bacterium]|nr:HD domain-containing phosphohydrolase [Gemmatimonadales bacterium]
MDVLVVDDEPTIRGILRRILEALGHRVREAPNGLEALRLLERQSADLVLSDIHMPELDGTALLREVSGRWPETGVVMITAVTDIETAVRCLNDGALDYLGKPFRVEEAAARVRQAIEKRRLILENRDYQRDLENRVREQAERIAELYVTGVQALAHALEAKDSYTRGHSARVAYYCTAMGGAMGLPHSFVQELRVGAELHDIGKIGVREAVLFKPGKLSPDEYAHIKEHPVIGERILEPLLRGHPIVLAVVRSHHERPDGLGFPDALVGSRIPLAARIAAVADTFDAMTTSRPYRIALRPERAVEELTNFAGSQFDAESVAAFLRAFPEPSSLPVSTRLAMEQARVGEIAWR